MAFRALFLAMAFSVSAFSVSAFATNDKKTVVTLSAASSLKESLEVIQNKVTQKHPDLELKLNLGSSGALQTQIENGAQVDLFIPAASRNMDALEAKDLILKGSRENLLTNALVLIVPIGTTQALSFEDLAKPKVKKIALGEPRSVPAGAYAREVFDTLKLRAVLERKWVYTSNVRQVLSYVESGNVDAGIVYASDALISTQVKVAANAPAKSHSQILYPVAILRSSHNTSAAKRVLVFLKSPEARTVFENHGFGILPSN